MLKAYRALDLTDVRGQLGGMVLADLGADVIRVEPPGGSEARRVGPFADDGPDGPCSLSFAAYNRNKRSIQLDLAADGGRATFLDLVRGSDFVLDSGPPALLDEAGLNHEVLCEANPQLVQVRVTPYGNGGPHAGLPAADLSVAAMGGPMSLQGDSDRPPVRVSVPQVWRHAGAEAAVAALVGHARMRTTGEGVFVDVSAQAAMTWTMLQGMTAAAIQGNDYERDGSLAQIGRRRIPIVHPARDGHVAGPVISQQLGKMVPWMKEEGAIDDAWLAREQWEDYDFRLFRSGGFAIEPDELNDKVDAFLAGQTKETIFARGLELGVTLAPIMSIEELVKFPQLLARDYFQDVKLPNGVSCQAPGAFAKCSSGPLGTSRTLASIGEHTAEVLEELASQPRQPARQNRPTPAPALPFEGLKVADFSWVGVGPMTGKCLADHGADVVRIESTTRADALRTAGPYKDNIDGWNRSQFFGEFNTSKRSLKLDLRHERAGEVTKQILAWADVVIESFTPGTVNRLGIGYEDAKKANPGVIFVSTCLAGQTGPLAHMAGYGYHAAALAGFYRLTGWPDRASCGPWNAYTDTIAPRFLTATLLAAIDHHRRTGEGQYIDLSQMEAALHFLAPEILEVQATNRSFTRSGNRSRDAATQGAYPCLGEDEWIAIAVENDAQWRALRGVLGDPEWARSEKYNTAAGRIEAHDLIDENLADWTRKHTPTNAMAQLTGAGIPAGHVQRSSDLLEDPQYEHRAFHRYLEHGEMGLVPYSGHQYRVSGYDHGPRAPAPLIGGDSFEILTGSLGLDDEQVADLMADQVIE
ncbi:MAG: CoA transferase [Gammaproteobacteria bacterium]|nr:CoA transferase [Gammaproteobacteria bacterium]